MDFEYRRVDCPRCGALAGQWCRNRNGAEIFRCHTPRRHAYHGANPPRRVYVLAIAAGEDTGYYVADDEPATADRNRALRYDSEESAEREAKIVRETWYRVDVSIERVA